MKRQFAKTSEILGQLYRILGRKPPNPGRELAQIGVEKRRKTVRETAQQMRHEMGLPDDPRLA